MTSENVENSEKSLKSFLCNFLECIKHGIEEISMPLIDFVNWLGLKYMGEGSTSFFLCSFCLTPFVFSLCTLDCLSCRFFL